MSSFINPILACDFYKVGHRQMYPEGTSMVYSNFTPRSFRLFGSDIDGATWFGLQGFIKSFLIEAFNRDFFARPVEEVIAEYDRRMMTSIGPGMIDSSHIAELHALGYLPIEIKALPEGSLVPAKVPYLTIKNTLPQFFWLTNYLETALSAELWKPTTTATTSRQYRKLGEKYAKLTGGSSDAVAFQFHDFSLRGISGLADSASAAGHLLSSVGTDTIPAIDYLEKYYHGKETFVGCSVPASEHSQMCCEGEDGELELIRRLVTKVVPAGIISLVVDGFNLWRVIPEHIVALKEDILARKENELGLAKVVFRPDSGDPVEIVCGCDYVEIPNYGDNTVFSELRDQGYSVIKCEGKFYRFNIDDNNYKITCTELSEAEVKGAIECLWEVFGGTINEAGFKELNPRVGLIYGDSITLDRAERIFQGLMNKGFASSNVILGCGSLGFQLKTRDSLGQAIKCTYIEVNGVGREIFKNPKTDVGSVKKSAKGLLRVENENGKFVLYDQQTWEQEQQGELRTVFKDGELLVDESLVTIRDRVMQTI